MFDRNYFVYVLGSPGGTLYIGMTNNLEKRLWEHRNESVNGFAEKYGCTNLLYYESTPDVNSAITREKQLKNWNRDKKELLINSMNPQWHDLSRDLFPQDPSTRLGDKPRLTRDDKLI